MVPFSVYNVVYLQIDAITGFRASDLKIVNFSGGYHQLMAPAWSILKGYQQLDDLRLVYGVVYTVVTDRRPLNSIYLHGVIFIEHSVLSIYLYFQSKRIILSSDYHDNFTN